jgi:hypothetical protein
VHELPAACHHCTLHCLLEHVGTYVAAQICVATTSRPCLCIICLLRTTTEDPTSLLAGQGFPELSASVSFGKVLAMLPWGGEMKRAADDRFLRELRGACDAGLHGV